MSIGVLELNGVFLSWKYIWQISKEDKPKLEERGKSVKCEVGVSICN